MERGKVEGSAQILLNQRPLPQELGENQRMKKGQNLGASKNQLPGNPCSRLKAMHGGEEERKKDEEKSM